MNHITADLVWSILPPRPEESHKGSFGKLLAVCGSLQYRGAAALCTEGALRTGCGIVTLASAEAVIAGAQVRMPEFVCFPCRTNPAGFLSASASPALIKELASGTTALLMGPGMGNNPDTRELTAALTTAASCPVVLDADALNACAGRLPRPASGELVITPHPGEMARLAGITTADVEADRERVASGFARQNGCTVVLKGHRTLVASPDGSLHVNTTGNSGLARGGSGDILAGMIGSLLAQGLSAHHAALCGVWLHGAAADRCAQKNSRTGMLPHDIFDSLGQLFREQNR